MLYKQSLLQAGGRHYTGSDNLTDAHSSASEPATLFGRPPEREARRIVAIWNGRGGQKVAS
jgi:hypothetical protein